MRRKVRQFSKPKLVPFVTCCISEKIIHARITNDERTLKRIVSKFHAYMTLARDPVTLDKASQENKLKDARDSFLSELDNYELGSRKTSLACAAEARQVSEYDQERLRIGKSLSPAAFLS